MLFDLSDEPPFLAGMAFATGQIRHSNRNYTSHVSIVGGVPLTLGLTTAFGATPLELMVQSPGHHHLAPTRCTKQKYLRSAYL